MATDIDGRTDTPGFSKLSNKSRLIQDADQKAVVGERGRRSGRAAAPQVVGVSKLKTKYEAHEAKRALCGEFDLFCADERVLPQLPKLLGAPRRFS